MGLNNRDKDASEKNYVIQTTLGAIATGVSVLVGSVPSAGQLLGFQVGGVGVSTTPVYQMAIRRAISGGGVTTFTVGNSVTLLGTYGVSSGMQGVSFVSTSFSVQSGDHLILNSSGANAAVTDLSVGVVIQATQDIKQNYGI